MKNYDLNKIFVSFFESVHGVAITIALVNVLEWLTNGHFKSVINGQKSLQGLVPLSPEWKAAKDKMKAWLECWTPSCVIRDGMKRGDANIEKMSGIMAFDFDLKDQTDKEFFLKEFKGSMVLYPSVFYAGLSASGQGFFVLVLTDTDDPQRFKSTYQKMAKEFEQCGWITDPQASSLSNFRFVSYDPEPYLNYDVVPYESVEPVKVDADFNAKASKAYETPSFEVRTVEEEYAHIEELIRTKGCSAWAYDREGWIKVGFAFVNTFGEQGRALFHEYSALCQEKYNATLCDRKYSELLRNSRRTVSIASFYYVCGLMS